MNELKIIKCPTCCYEFKVGDIDWLFEPNLRCPECGQTGNIQVEWDDDFVLHEEEPK